MTRNMRGWDRALRLVVGVAVLSFYGALEAPARYFTLLGLIPVSTALIGWCPLFGINRPKSPPAA